MTLFLQHPFMTIDEPCFRPFEFRHPHEIRHVLHPHARQCFRPSPYRPEQLFVAEPRSWVASHYGHGLSSHPGYRAHRHPEPVRWGMRPRVRSYADVIQEYLQLAAEEEQRAQKMRRVESSASSAKSPEPAVQAPAPTTSETKTSSAVTAASSSPSLLDWKETADAFEWSLRLSPHCTVSKLGLQLLRPTQDPETHLLDINVQVEEQQGLWTVRETVRRVVGVPRGADVTSLSAQHVQPTDGSTEGRLVVRAAKMVPTSAPDSVAETAPEQSEAPEVSVDAQDSVEVEQAEEPAAVEHSSQPSQDERDDEYVSVEDVEDGEDETSTA